MLSPFVNHRSQRVVLILIAQIIIVAGLVLVLRPAQGADGTDAADKAISLEDSSTGTADWPMPFYDTGRTRALTLLLDGGKGALALLLARAMTGAEDLTQIAALAAMLGHCFPVWLRFQGGKGVATFLGLMLALHWPAGIACCAAWLVGAALWRISSMGALVSAATSTFALMFMGKSEAVALGAVLTILIFIRHRANIARIKDGTEPKIGQKSG